MAFTLSPYFGIIVLGAIGLFGFLIPVLALATILGPKNKTKTKQLPFECGSVSVGNVSEQRFKVRFYLIAMLFILFDVEVIFMYPWALVMPELGWTGYLSMLSFIAVLTVGLIYVWRKGLFNWNDA